MAGARLDNECQYNVFAVSDTRDDRGVSTAARELTVAQLSLDADRSFLFGRSHAVVSLYLPCQCDQKHLINR